MLTIDNRENARMVEMCYKTHTTTINPIVDWTTDEVWEFIHEYNIPYCCLYDEGFKRLGCIGCPMGTRKQREYEFERYPKYKALYLKAFEKMLENRGGGYESKRSKESIRMADSRGCDERVHSRSIQTARTRDFKTMTPKEIMDWWID